MPSKELILALFSLTEIPAREVIWKSLSSSVADPHRTLKAWGTWHQTYHLWAVCICSIGQRENLKSDGTSKNTKRARFFVKGVWCGSSGFTDQSTGPRSDDSSRDPRIAHCMYGVQNESIVWRTKKYTYISWSMWLNDSTKNAIQT